MVLEREILIAVPSLLEELVGQPVTEGSLSPGLATAGVDLILGAGPHRFVIAAKARVSSATLEHAARHVCEAARLLGGGAIPLVAVPFAGKRSRELLAQLGVAWLDLSGNAVIAAQNLRVLVVANENRFKKSGRPENPFSSKSSRVARALLAAPVGTGLIQSELARRTGLGRGFVSRIVRQLLRDDYVARAADNSVAVKQPERLLDDWRAAYVFERHRIVKAQLFARSGSDAVEKLHGVLGDVRHAFTGLAGAWLLSEHATFRLAVVFVDALPSKDALQAAGVALDERGANVWFVIPNDTAVYEEAYEVSGFPCCSPLQVYLDLKAQPERAAEAADEIRSVIVKDWKHGRR